MIPELHTNVSGKVRNTKLHKSKSLWPLFEAISNSFHAIDDKGSDNGLIQIRVIRQGNKDILAECTNIEIYPILHFEVVDNGIGLDEENFKSFCTAESEFKMQRGAKGIGRFVCLKAFKMLKFSSIYRDKDNKPILREFTFKASDTGIFNYKSSETAKLTTGTKMVLSDFKPEYQETCPRELEEIAEKVIDHFLVYYINQKAPRIEIKEDLKGNKIELNNLYNTTFKASIKNESFKLFGETFTIHLLRLFDVKKGHRIHYCGNDRVVKDERLQKYLPDLGSSVSDEDGLNFTYQVYLTSKFLDEHVDNERTNFDFPENIDDSDLQDLVNDSPNLERIREKVVESLESVLSVYLNKVRSDKYEKYSDHITDSAPQFRPLLKYKPDVVKRMSPNLSGNKLNIELYRVQSELEIEVKELGETILNDNSGIVDTEDYLNLYNDYIEKFNDIGKANLAKYIVHRKSVIQLLDKFLGISVEIPVNLTTLNRSKLTT